MLEQGTVLLLELLRPKPLPTEFSPSLLCMFLTALMSIVSHNDVNYKVKLAVTCQLDKNLDKKIVETLVEEPKKGALGGHQKNPKGNKGKGKPEPALVPTFDVKLCISR